MQILLSMLKTALITLFGTTAVMQTFGGTTTLALAHAIGLSAVAHCHGVDMPLTPAVYATFSQGAPLPSNLGIQCESASESPLYDTPSGKLEAGYYVQDPDGTYQNVVQITYTSGTSTEVFTGIQISTTTPTQSAITITKTI